MVIILSFDLRRGILTTRFIPPLANQWKESQLHIIAAWQIFKWTGNLEFLKDNYAFAKRTWTWLQQHDSNHITPYFGRRYFGALTKTVWGFIKKAIALFFEVILIEILLSFH